MSQPPYQIPPQPVHQVPPAKPGKRFGFLALLITGIVALVVGIAIGGLGRSGGTATPAATVTTTANHTIYVTSPTEGGGATEQPTEQPTDTGGYTPRKSDWAIGIKIKSKQCFGSAGCNITFRIAPAHVGGANLPDSGSLDVTYKITGCEDPYSNTFTVENSSASYDEEESCSTTSASKKLAAVVTAVDYSP